MLAERLALVDDGDDRFVSKEPTDPLHVFGGLVIAQALRAAAATVTDRSAHSLHASFLASGAGGTPVTYEVERTRDGGSFSTRRVIARQDRGPILVLTASFQGDEQGPEYDVPPAEVPGPDEVPVGRYDRELFESRDVPPDPNPPHARRAWFRLRGPIPDDPALHLQGLAFLSDHGPTRAAREPHAHLEDDARRLSVSLDHSVWFHRPANLDQWLLSELIPVATGRGRGLAMGTIRQADGTVLATVAQEVLLRERV